MVAVSNRTSETSGEGSQFYICLGTQMVKVPHVGSSVSSVDLFVLMVASEVTPLVYLYLPFKPLSPALSSGCPVVKLYFST